MPRSCNSKEEYNAQAELSHQFTWPPTQGKSMRGVTTMLDGHKIKGELLVRYADWKSRAAHRDI